MKCVCIALVLATIGGTNSAAGWKVCNVAKYGAQPNTATPQTAHIQAAIDDCASDGGGEVVLPSDSNWTSGSLFLKSNIVFRILPGASLLGSTRMDNETYPRVYTRVGGTMSFSPASLLNGALCTDLSGFNSSGIGDQCRQWTKLSNVTIIGSAVGADPSSRPPIGARAGAGTIDGQGEGWWKQLDNRPTLLGLLWVNGLRLEDLVLTRSPFWTTHPTFCDSVVADGLTVLTTGPNTDGFDPDSSSNVLLQRSFLSCGDDVVAIKSGKDADGRAVGIPTTNVTVRNCAFGSGHGLSIGSEMSGNVTNVLVENVTMTGTERGVRVKSAQGRGGLVANVTYRNMVLSGVGTAVSVSQFYSDPNAPGPSPVFQNISVANLTAVDIPRSHALGTAAAGVLECLKQSPCLSQISLADVSAEGAQAWQCENVNIRSVRVEPAPGSECFSTSLLES